MSVSPPKSPERALNPEWKPKVSIVDDDECLHQLLKDLSHSGDFELFGLFLDSAPALQFLPRHPPDVVLMDHCLPSIPGVECAQRLKILMPELSIVMLTSYSEPSLFFNALMAGVNGFLSKPFTTPELLHAIKEASRGGFVLGKEGVTYCSQLCQQLRRLGAEQNLSLREEQMLACIFQGLTDKEIASKLCIGTATVHTHLHQLFVKFEVHSRKDLIGKFLIATQNVRIKLSPVI